MALVKNGMALRVGDQQKSIDALNFRKLHKCEWNLRVNSAAVKIMNAKKRNKQSAIPLTADLQKLRLHIMNGMKDMMVKVQQSAMPQDWTQLAKLTMARLILFNKRWRAKVTDLKMKDYDDRPDWQLDESGEMDLALSPVDKMFAKRYCFICCV